MKTKLKRDRWLPSIVSQVVIFAFLISPAYSNPNLEIEMIEQLGSSQIFGFAKEFAQLQMSSQTISHFRSRYDPIISPLKTEEGKLAMVKFAYYLENFQGGEPQIIMSTITTEIIRKLTEPSGCIDQLPKLSSRPQN